MTTIADVRGNLATIASAITPSTGVTGWYGSAYVTDQINPGAIIVTRPPFEPWLTFGSNKAEHTFRLIAYAARGSESSEAVLDALADHTGAGSLIAAVQLTSNWSVDVDYAQVISAGQVQVTTFGLDAAEYLACYFDVKVVW